MTSRRLAGAAALALALGACAAPGTGSDRLAVDGPRWLLGGLDARLDIRVSPALAEHDALLVVAVGNKIVERVGTEKGRARVAIPAAKLASGANLVSVKTGSERRELVIRVVPLAYAAVPIAIAGTILGAAWLRRRRVSR